jgi:hypothetical protein
MPNSYIQIIDKAEQLWLAGDTSPYVCDCLDGVVAGTPDAYGAEIQRLHGWIRQRIDGHFSVVGYIYGEDADWEVTNHHTREDVVAFRKQLFVELREAFAAVEVTT